MNVLTLVHNPLKQTSIVVRQIYRYLFSLILVALISWVIYFYFFIPYEAAAHTFIELAYILIGFSAFMVIWNVYDKVTAQETILGFGFLTAFIFNGLHIYFYPTLGLYPIRYYSLFAWFSVAARLSEGITILLCLCSTHKDKKTMHKNKALFLSLTATVIVAILMYRFQGVLPALVTLRGITDIKVFISMCLVFLFTINLYLLRNKITLSRQKVITYNHIFFAVFFLLLAEIVNVLIPHPQSFLVVFSHVLRGVFYIFIFKGIFISTVLYPYEKLNETSIGMNDILDDLPLGILTYNREGNVSFINKTGEELLEIHKNEIMGLTSDDLFKRFSYLTVPDKSVVSSVLQGKVYSVVDTEPYKNSNGQIIMLDIKVHKVTNGVLVLFSDARKEQELVNLRLQTQTILNAVGNLVIVVDRHMKVVLCNKPLTDILHKKEGCVVGKDLRSLISDVKWDTYGIIDELFKNEQANVESILFLSENERLDLLLHTAPIYNMDRDVVGAILVASDISSYKQAQQHVMQQEKLALLGQMGAGIVHETKNFLTTIKGSSQILKIIAKDQEVIQYAAKIDKATDEVNQIITNFLSLSKPKPLESASVPLGQLIDSMKSMLETTSFLKGIHLDLHCPIEEESIYCDENQIKQVILNIAKNAIEAMQETKVPVLKIETGYHNEDEIFIRIVDNGPGIPVHDQNKLGTPFFTTKEMGTGLGLNVCYQIISDHGGRIELKSETGKGTAFTVVLPCE